FCDPECHRYRPLLECSLFSYSRWMARFRNRSLALEIAMARSLCEKTEKVQIKDLSTHCSLDQLQELLTIGAFTSEPADVPPVFINSRIMLRDIPHRCCEWSR